MPGTVLFFKPFSPFHQLVGLYPRIGSSELNIDFVNILGNGNRLDPQNLYWIKPPYYLYSLRQAVLDTTKLKLLLDKVQTKAYLTDRRLTGQVASNRDRRWELSLNDPQFAPRQECIRIEAKLFSQIFEFSSAPELGLSDDVIRQIQHATGSTVRLGNLHCPVTGQAIHYDTFIRSIQAQEYGLFPYHIIYLTPLTNKSGGGRHIAENITWVTELGNRLLGADSVEKIVGEIFAIADYHKTSTNTLRPHSINYYTCFISYSSKDQDFAEKLYADLQSEGVHCWFAPESLKTGDFFWDRIDESIRLCDKLLIVLSQQSVESAWVRREIIAAYEMEDQRQQQILLPIRLDDTIKTTNKVWAADIRRQRHITDFSNWEENDGYQKAFNRLLRDLKVEPPKIG